MTLTERMIELVESHTQDFPMSEIEIIGAIEAFKMLIIRRWLRDDRL